MLCFSCGTQQPDSANFCSKCGRALGEKPPVLPGPPPHPLAQLDSDQVQAAYYRTLVEHLPVGTYIVALDSLGTPLYVSPHIPRLLGFSPSEWTTGPALFLKQLHPADRERVLADVARSAANGERFSAEYRLMARDGQVLWVRDEAVVVHDETGRPRYLHGVWEDITERKQAEEALHASEARLRLVLEQMPAVLWTTDNDLRFTSSSGAGLATLNLRPDEVVGMSLFEFFQTEDADFLPIAAHRRALQGESVSYEFTWMDRTFHTHLEPLRNREGLISDCIGVALDITDRKRAEEVLRQSEEQFRGSFEQAAVGIAHLSLDGRLLLVNPKFCEIVGYSNEELIGRSFQEITHPDDLPGNLELERHLVTGESSMYSLEKRYIRKDGSCVWVNLTLALAHGAEGEPLYRIAVIENIEKRKKMVAALLHSAEYFSQAFHDNTAAMSIIRLMDQRFVDVNQGFLCLLGYRREEVIGRTAAELQIWEDPEEYTRSVQALWAQQPIHNLELRFRMKTGATRDGMLSLELVDFGGEQCILGQLYDITDRKRLDVAVHQAKRLEGRLEGIVLAAREMNHRLTNDLQIPLTTLEMIEDARDLPASVQQLVHDAKSAITAAEQHVKQFQHVVRVETWDTPIGPALDLSRSTTQDQD